MRVRRATAATVTAVALTALTASTALVAPAASAGTATAAKPAPCAEKNLTVRAEPSDDSDGVLRLSVRNDSARACLVDRVPTVTYGDLDGAALPVPTVRHAGRSLAPHTTVYAAVLSLSDSKDADDEARTVMSLHVAAVPDHDGRTFQVLKLGAPAGLAVYDPVTTLWQSSPHRATQVLLEETTGRGIIAA
ncbi:DUF4232 domain-containing protein [Streptomyces kunmingensis]|uniref:DUF4232 domain-containing protein n=1 Tax=Streptomyces kunmingensis TaxID=68225 RepID=A0ABU6CNS0_9ACTN|nr:DUF4232 domain-containing protein [Streptomyces kunmingensis]MEB3966297.1 DUF4232 domain-containing protein [Streptomyces kunmingensis]